MKLTNCVGVIVLQLSLFACVPESKQFALPPGDADRGKAEFSALGCPACHSIGAVTSQELVGINIPLGGEVPRIDSYAELVTSIINPSHRMKPGHKAVGTLPDGTSAMQDYNSVMTVQQLIDLVTFLQAQYKLTPPIYHYPIYL